MLPGRRTNRTTPVSCTPVEMLNGVVSGDIIMSSGECSHREEEIIKRKVDTTEEPGNGNYLVISEGALTVI